MYLIQAIKAVQTVEESQKRIPDKYAAHSYFGAYDLWSYRPVFDDVLCPECRANALEIFFSGTGLRRQFPYLVVEDEDTILVRQHPNCRCELKRIVDEQLYLVAVTFLGL